MLERPGAARLCCCCARQPGSGLEQLGGSLEQLSLEQRGSLAAATTSSSRTTTATTTVVATATSRASTGSASGLDAFGSGFAAGSCGTRGCHSSGSDHSGNSFGPELGICGISARDRNAGFAARSWRDRGPRGCHSSGSDHSPNGFGPELGICGISARDRLAGFTARSWRDGFGRELGICGIAGFTAARRHPRAVDANNHGLAPLGAPLANDCG